MSLSIQNNVSLAYSTVKASSIQSQATLSGSAESIASAYTAFNYQTHTTGQLDIVA